jgi:hypothetical protein
MAYPESSSDIFIEPRLKRLRRRNVSCAALVCVTGWLFNFAQTASSFWLTVKRRSAASWRRHSAKASSK